MRRTLIFASLLLALPSFAGAQHRGGMVGAGPVGARPVGGSPAVVAAPRAASSAPRVMASAPRATVRVSTGTRVATAPVGVRGGGRVNGTVAHHVSVMSGLANLPVFATDFADAPGLGFDFPHLAAINSGQGSGQGSGRRRARFDQGVPFGFGGFLLSSPGVVVMEGQPGENQQPAAEDNPAANAASTESGRELEEQFLPATRSSAASAVPPRDAEEYVFVRRDGGLLFAVAYSWDNGTLRYVTREGLRRSVTRDALDMDATQQFNEQRGLNFHLPA